jgi:Holliday junction resolvasome RuvABC endonuclease subunit
MTDEAPPKAILGLDLGVKMGVAYWVERCGLVAATEVSVIASPSRRATRLIALEDRLEQLLDTASYRVVVLSYEAIPLCGAIMQSSSRMLFWSEAIIERLALRHGMECLSVAPASLKKHATGNGRAAKDAVHRAAVLRWPGITFATHNIADAAWVADWTARGMAITEKG